MCKVMYDFRDKLCLDVRLGFSTRDATDNECPTSYPRLQPPLHLLHLADPFSTRIQSTLAGSNGVYGLGSGVVYAPPPFYI